MGQLVAGGWTAEQSDALKDHIAAGLSYRDSAAQINMDFGTSYTRNSAIGRANRLGLVAPERPKKERGPRVRKPSAKPYVSRQRIAAGRRYEAISNPEEIKLRCVEIACTVTFADVTGCRFTPDDGPFLFCDGPRKEGSSFCPSHHALCWVPATSNAPKARKYYGTDFARGAA